MLITHNYARMPDEYVREFYLWSQRELRQEIDNDFPHIDRLKSEAGETYVEHMRSISYNRQEIFGSALLKLHHPHAWPILGLQLTSEEKREVEIYTDYRRKYPLRHRDKYSPIDQPPNLPLRSQTRRALLDIFEEFPIPGRSRKSSPLGWSIAGPIRSAYFATSFRLPTCELHLCHQLRPMDGDPLQGLLIESVSNSSTSLPYWLGVSRFEARVASVEDSEIAIGLAKDSCSRYFNFATTILNLNAPLAHD